MIGTDSEYESLQIIEKRDFTTAPRSAMARCGRSSPAALHLRAAMTMPPQPVQQVAHPCSRHPAHGQDSRAGQLGAGHPVDPATVDTQYVKISPHHCLHSMVQGKSEEEVLAIGKAAAAEAAANVEKAVEDKDDMDDDAQARYYRCGVTVPAA